MDFTPSHLRGFPQIDEHNWLIHAVMIDFLEEVAAKYASGLMVDVGCGRKPYESIFRSYISRHIGIDLPHAVNKLSKVDIIGTAYNTNLKTESCDIVLCTEVLEHLEEPLQALVEINRILKPKGALILTVPFFWPIHEAPRDFFRYTQYGLQHLFESAGFDTIEIRPLTGYLVTFSQLTIYFLRRFQRGFVLRTFGRFFDFCVQYMAYYANPYDKSFAFTNLYGVVATKTDGS